MIRKKLKYFVLFLFIIILFLGFFFYNNKKEVKGDNSLKIQFEQSDIVKIKNVLPVSDSLGRSFDGRGTEDGVQGFVEFFVSNLSNKKQKFEIILTKQKSSDMEIRDNYIKLFFTNFMDEPYDGFTQSHVPSFNELSYLNDKPNSKLLYRGEITSGSKDHFRLRVWLSDSYALINRLETFQFDIDVRVV